MFHGIDDLKIIFRHEHQWLFWALQLIQKNFMFEVKINIKMTATASFNMAPVESMLGITKSFRNKKYSFSLS